jgi:hypothetical protein
MKKASIFFLTYLSGHVENEGENQKPRRQRELAAGQSQARTKPAPKTQ